MHKEPMLEKIRKMTFLVNYSGFLVEKEPNSHNIEVPNTAQAPILNCYKTPIQKIY